MRYIELIIHLTYNKMEEFYASLHTESVVISGGGVHGITMYHLLWNMKQMGSFHAVKHWHGTSIGSICALCMLLSISPDTIQPYLEDIQDKFQMTPEAMLTIPETYGMLDMNAFRTMLETLIESAGILPSCTFAQLHTITQSTLSVFACCIDTNQTECFNHIKTPNVSVIDAIMASCAIPVVFQIRTISGK